MKPTIVILLLSFFIASCSYPTKMSRCKKDYAKDICRLTRDGRDVYMTINIKGKGKLLLVSYDLCANGYINANITTNNYTDTLYNILIKKYWRPIKPVDLLEKRFIDMNIYHKISKFKPLEVYDMYFDKDGFPKNDKFTEQEIEAAVAYLIDCNVYIFGGQYFLYRVSNPPTGECNKYDKKRNGI